MQHSRGVLTALFILCLLTSAAILGQDLFVSDLSAGMVWHIIVQLQLPLVFTAILVGAGLSVSAATLQVTLHNPLADPGIIGISSGASLMAALVLLTLHLDFVNYFYLLPLACFVGALLSTGLIYMVARRLRASATAVILAGIAISTIAGAIMAWLYILADAQALRNLTFWLMGSLYQTDWWILAVAGPLITAGLFYQLSQAGALNWLYGGSALAAAAGANPSRLVRNNLIVCALCVGAAVSVAGSIAFVGLLVPHFLRMIIGFDNRRLLPACALCGALVLLLVALFSELVSWMTLPVSMVTATIGGPLLLIALYKGQWRMS
ncbi:FecCD family ABC transporter permease [Salinimonas iocasae]|uniref:Iron ABC transporter permease n=1 Tax=Salinimonas iocasae TaxID=2572577 RepID=A0A5B7YEI5_9ALTE|nr:iron ABC transporter permease [Salinimonas iocasae]QCZ94031.1 iron ABC transporter permease [Salinimonas iocasae]